MRLHGQQEHFQTTMPMHKGCMTMLVNFGLCFLLLYFLMVGQPVGCLLAAFLIILRTVERGSRDTTLKTLFFLVWAVALVGLGQMYVL